DGGDHRPSPPGQHETHLDRNRAALRIAQKAGVAHKIGSCSDGGHTTTRRFLCHPTWGPWHLGCSRSSHHRGDFLMKTGRRLRLGIRVPILAAGAILALVATGHAEEAAKIDTGDNAWMLTSSALVLSMTAPGLALFYGGLVRSKNV